MNETNTPSIQDYLKHIYNLTSTGSAATTTELAGLLGVAPASVTGMLQRLAKANPPLVYYRKHQGVTLTPAGERAALEVIRHHRLIETYLVRALGYSWDEVHEEACRLEHVISEDFEARIAEALGHPVRDPHGDPIPLADLSMPRDTTRPLASLKTAEVATVKRVANRDPALLRYLSEIGIVPDVHLTVLHRSEFDGNLTLHIDGQDLPIVLGTIITSQIFVEVP